MSASFAGVAPADAPVSVSRIAADGVALTLPADAASAVRIRAHTRMLDIDFALRMPRATPPFRYRFQLEGADGAWRDPIGLMRFTVRFNDAKGNAVSGEEFDAHGESPGWTGAPESSRFILRRESLEVPAGAARLQVWLSSAGPQQTMGVYALDALAVTLIPRDPGQTPERVELIPRDGPLMETSAGTPAGWARHGTSLGIAQITPRTGKAPLIVMRDDRPDAFGGWLTTTEKSAPLDGIARVEIEWKEAYSIGWGGNARQSYPYLPAGEYRMRLQPITFEGKPAGDVSTTRIVVVPPFYETKTFWFVTAAGAGLLIAAAARQFTRRRMQRRLDALERERAVEHERSRIARDLHDNLGADLTHLALLSDLALADAGDAAKVRRHFDQIFDLARNLTRQVDEMVWAVNPANDSLKGFVPFLSNYAQNYLLAAGIPCRLDIPAAFPDAPLSSTQRHHLFLTVKEALHNIVKHSHATEAWLRIRKDDHRLKVVVEDNGRGIAEPAAIGDGTGNMQQRIATIGGTFERISEPGKGTRISLSLPLAKPV
ncbi:hypothetical protein LBMAG56_11420 [Verrucomicrobiota bacterium]|nr:hypothetical protein LBMAG56_11420 [Verrucomicrobiota bacterium]